MGIIFRGVSISLPLVYKLTTKIVLWIIAAIQKKSLFLPNPLPNVNLSTQIKVPDLVWVHPRFVNQADPNWTRVKFSGLLRIRCFVNWSKLINRRGNKWLANHWTKQLNLLKNRDCDSALMSLLLNEEKSCYFKCKVMTMMICNF